EGPEMVPQPPLLDLQERSGCARVAQILSLPQGERNTGANAPTEKSPAPRSDAKSCHRTLLSPCGRESRSGRGAAATFGPAREGWGGGAIARGPRGRGAGRAARAGRYRRGRGG